MKGYSIGHKLKVRIGIIIFSIFSILLVDQIIEVSINQMQFEQCVTPSPPHVYRSMCENISIPYPIWILEFSILVGAGILILLSSLKSKPLVHFQINQQTIYNTST